MNFHGESSFQKCKESSIGNNLGYLNTTFELSLPLEFENLFDFLAGAASGETCMTESSISMFRFDPKKSVMRTVFKFREKRSVRLPTVDMQSLLGQTSINCAIVAENTEYF